tara:strand:- start:724 stop:1053 length:330 start_codon:yes stop_codon:yes gene_type:complete
MDITKEDFTKVLKDLRDQYDYDKLRAEKLSNIYGADVMPSDNSRITNALFRLLHFCFPPTGNFCAIQAFCYELDFGRSVDIEFSADPISDLWVNLKSKNRFSYASNSTL